MKKTIFSFCICLLSFFSFSQSWIEFVPAGATEPIVNVLRSDSLLVEFEVMVPGMYDTQIDTFNRVEIKGHTKLDSVGFPEVPVVSFLVAIPYCDSINLTINPLDSSLFSGYNIYPAPEFVKDTTPDGYVYLKEEFSYNRPAYSTDNWFPGIIGNETDHGAIRSQSVIRILIYPVQFNPSRPRFKRGRI